MSDRSSVEAALALMEQGETLKARAILEILHARYPDNAEIALAVGATFARVGDWAAGLPYFLHAADRRGEGDGRWAVLAIRSLVAAHRLDEAIALHDRMRSSLRDIEYAPSLATALLPEVPGDLGEMNRARDAYERAIADLDDVSGERAEDRLLALPTNFAAAYQGRPHRAAQERIARFYARVCPALNFVAPAPAAPRTGRIRIGFVSAHLFNHTIGKLTRGLIAELDRTRFEVTVFSTRPTTDEIGRFIAERSDSFVVLPNDLSGARARIVEAAPDILFYPDIGMEPFTYFLAFARLAPVQCVTWGHPVTTGIPAIDYFLSAGDLESADAGEAQEQYSERLIRLSAPPTYLYPVQTSDPTDRPELPVGATIYTCVQQPMKMHPEFDPLLFAILRRDPKGMALFIDQVPSLTAALKDRFARGAPDVAERIKFLPRLGQNGFLELLKASHVVLDTIHFSGGISSVEALASGKAVVTWPHPTLMAGRVTSAYYRQMGLEACIARDLDDYVALAVRLGTDARYRGEIERTIGERRDRLFRRKNVVRELEAFFEESLSRSTP